jgi:uncharacterized protein YkwD
MRKRLITLPAVLAVTAALALGAPAAAEAAKPTKAEQRVVAQINKVRAKQGLRKVKVGSSLQRDAKSWSRHLRRSGSFHHGSLSAGTGEVIAWGTCSWFTPAQAVRAWMRSSSHRALVVRPGFRKIGAGWAKGPWRGHGCVKMAVVRFR